MRWRAARLRRSSLTTSDMVLTPAAAPRRSARCRSNRAPCAACCPPPAVQPDERAHVLTPTVASSFGSLSLEQSRTRCVLPASGGPASRGDHTVLTPTAAPRRSARCRSNKAPRVAAASPLAVSLTNVAHRPHSCGSASSFGSLSLEQSPVRCVLPASARQPDEVTSHSSGFASSFGSLTLEQRPALACCPPPAVQPHEVRRTQAARH